MPRGAEGEASESHLENFLAAMDVSKDQYDQLSKDVQMFVSDEEVGHTFAYWYKRYGPVIRDSVLLDSKKRDLILMKLDEDAYRNDADDILPKQPHEIDFETTVANLEKLFASKKTLIRRRYECLRISCPPLTASCVPFRDYANMIKRMDEDARLKELDYTALKTLQFVAGLQDPSLREVRLRILRRLDTHTEDAPLTIEDLVADCENFTALKMDNTDMEGSHEAHVHFSPPALGRRCDKNQEDDPTVAEKASVRTLSPSPLRTLEPTSMSISGDVLYASSSTQALVSRRTWKKLGSPPLEPCIMPVKTADGSPMKIDGRFSTDFFVRDRTTGKNILSNGTCYVTECTNLLGLEWCIQLPAYKELKDKYHCRMVTKEEANREEIIADLKKQYAEVFKCGLGRCVKTKAKLLLRDNAVPVFKKKRPVPYASVPDLDAEIDRLVAEQVISPVEHSEWATPIVVVKKKNGQIRLGGDFSTELNDALQLHQHPLPTAEDVFTKLNGGQLFTQIDFAEAYLEVEVEEESKEMLRINTHRGLYRYNRLPFGVKSAPGVFQQIMDSIICGLEGVAAYLDDVIVTGRTQQEHRHNLEALFGGIHEYGFRVLLEKCNFLMPQIRYLGCIIDKDGRHPDPVKIEVIRQLPVPKNVAEVRSFLGMINYYGSFVAEMRQLRAPLDALLKKNVPFKWNEECEAAFNRAKEVLASDLLLTHFDPSLAIIVAADASDHGIGAVILHMMPDGTGKAIWHASRSLTAAERNYGQIEKEGLALIFAVSKFHRYIYGRRFKLLTDHKPLLHIFGPKKVVPVYTANRLQRWKLILLGYDFEIEYQKTTEFGQADVLSRLIPPRPAQTEDIVIAKIEQDILAVQSAAVKALPVTRKTTEEESRKDERVSQVIWMLQTGTWPSKPKEQINSWKALSRELSVQNGCLYFGHRIVVPTSLQEAVLKQLHEGHPRMARMKMLARGYVYWTNINRDIEEAVRHCRNCQEAAKMPKKTVLNSWTTEKKPWDRIHILCGTTEWVIVSDNGTQFTAKEFQEFCDMQGIEHKIKEGGTSEKLAEFLQCYRRTPCASTPGHLSPAEVFLGRQLRTSLTLLKESAKEEGTRNVEIEEQFNRHHGAQKRSYHQEELVWVRDYRPGHEKWIPARVKNRYGRAVYDVLTEEDDLWKRHANQMRGEKHQRVSCERTEASKMPFNQEDRRYHGMARTIVDINDNVKDRTPTIVPPATTRPARQRRPPRRLQPDPKMKTYGMHSS
ncbi:hypothetical protein RB195_010799 [Necator americanus]|uniref:RNA-directed DNA polymerase n=1 Tax=Necator americanus TaxID=51031 RepID=A0ABR1CZI3_NECAM